MTVIQTYQNNETTSVVETSSVKSFNPNQIMIEQANRLLNYHNLDFKYLGWYFIFFLIGFIFFFTEELDFIIFITSELSVLFISLFKYLKINKYLKIK